jgi:methyl-accepting chemotaxis protein
MFSHIRTKILALFVLNVVLWLTFLGVIFYWIASRSLERQLEDSLKATAAVLASQWDGSLLLPLRPGMENSALYQSFLERLQRLKQQTELDGIYIASAERVNIVATERNLRIGQPLPRLDLLGKQLDETMKGGTSASALIRVEDRYYKSALAPIYSQDRIVAVLIADISPHYLTYLQTFRNSIFLFTGIALLCCIFSAHLFSRSITTPISKMVKGVEEISKARYEQPLKLSGSDELSHLATSIENMRQNILHRDIQMKMMLSGIAHEIRNPLGGIELFAGILAKEKLEPAQRAYIERILSEIQNLKQLLNEFLDFARPRTLESENISVPHLLSEIESLFSEEIHQK